VIKYLKKLVLKINKRREREALKYETRHCKGCGSKYRHKKETK